MNISPTPLRKRAEFLAARSGEKRRGPLFLLEIRDRGDGQMPRAGYTVTKKVGNAPERNRVRRRLKEAMRIFAAREMMPGHDYVIIARRAVLSASFATLKTELARRIGGSGIHG